MKNGDLFIEFINEDQGRDDRHITAFTASKRRSGFQIEVAGCVCMQPAKNGNENVIGVIELDDQTVPVIDGRSNPEGDITDLCCIVLFENLVGDTSIVTARLFEDACQVFDLIVECMDHPASDEHLYSISDHSSSSGIQTVQ